MPTAGINTGAGSSTMQFPEQPWKIEAEIKPMSKEHFIQECAIELYSAVDFNNSKVSPSVNADDCVLKSYILAHSLFYKRDQLVKLAESYY